MSHTQHLNALETAGLIQLAQIQPELEYLFRHTLVQEAAYTSLLKSDRQSLHRWIGTLLEEAYPNRLQELSPRLAQHFHAAGEYGHAVKYYQQAGDTAMSRYALAEAVEHFNSILSLASENDLESLNFNHLYTQRGRALELSAQYAQALENYHQMEKLGKERDDPDLRLGALMAQATLYATPSSVHDAKKCHDLCDEALIIARQSGNLEAEARIFWTIALLFDRTGHSDKAVESGEQALALARKTGQVDLQAYILNDLSTAYFGRWQIEQGMKSQRESQALFRKLENLPMLVDNLSTQIVYEYINGEFDQAIASYREADRIARSIGNLWGQAFCRMYTGLIYFDCGEPGSAIEVMEACLYFSQKAGFLAPIVQTQADLGMVYASLGAIDRGLEYMDKAEQAIEMLSPSWGTYQKIARARVHLYNKDLHTANMLLKAARDNFKQGTATGFVDELFLLRADAELLLQEGDHSGLQNITAALLNQITPKIRAFYPEVLFYRGMAQVGLGDTDQAFHTLSSALDVAKAIGHRRLLWEIYAALASFAEGHGDLVYAKACRVQAREILEYIANHTGFAELSASFVNMPQVRSLMQA